MKKMISRLLLLSGIVISILLNIVYSVEVDKAKAREEALIKTLAERPCINK